LLLSAVLRAPCLLRRVYFLLPAATVNQTLRPAGALAGVTPAVLGTAPATRRSAANARSVTLTIDVGGGTQTCYKILEIQSA